MPFMRVFYQVFSLFLIMGAGWAFARRGYLEKEATRGISNLILKLTLPCLIVGSLQKPFSPDLLSVSLFTLAVATAFYLGIMGLSVLAVRVMRTPPRQRGALAFSLSFSNCAFIGFPVVSSILGEDALFITSIHNVLFNILAFSAGVVMMQGESGTVSRKSVPLSRVFNLNVIATLVGFALFLGSVTIPSLLLVPLTALGSLTTPLAMIVTGAMLARTPMRAAFGDWRVFATAALRLAAWPLLAWVALRAAGVSGQLGAITVIVAGMPAASNTGIIAEVYGGDTETASSSVFLSTLFSVVSIPVLAFFLA